MATSPVADSPDRPHGAASRGLVLKQRSARAWSVHCTEFRGLLTDTKVTVAVVEHRDRLARVNVESINAALPAHVRRSGGGTRRQGQLR